MVIVIGNGISNQSLNPKFLAFHCFNALRKSMNPSVLSPVLDN